MSNFVCFDNMQDNAILGKKEVYKLAKSFKFILFNF